MEQLRDIEKFFLELDYQKEFTYEERIDLFNAFQIPVSQIYFVPFFSYFSLHINRYKKDLFSTGYSHSGAVSLHSQKGEYFKGRSHQDWKENPDTKFERRSIGKYYNNIDIIRNAETKNITSIKGYVGIWNIRFFPRDFTMDMELDWEAIDKLKLEDRRFTHNNVCVNPEKSILFLRLTKFK